MKRLVTALFIALTVPAIATAGSHKPSQLVLQVQAGIAQYGVKADLSQLPTTVVAQLKGVIDRKGSYSQKQHQIRTILRKAGMDI